MSINRYACDRSIEEENKNTAIVFPWPWKFPLLVFNNFFPWLLQPKAYADNFKWKGFPQN